MVLQDRAKATRAAVIAGAAAVFEEHGYGSTSLTQVAERAQVTKGAMYFHYPSKEDLARAVIAEQHRMAEAEGQRVLAKGLTPLESMILICATFGLQLLEEPVVRAGIRLTFEATSFGPPVREPYVDWIATIEELAARAKADRQLRSSVDAEAFARYLVASFTGVQMVSCVLTERQDVMQRIEQMWDIMLPGILHEDLLGQAKKLSAIIPGAVLEPAPVTD